MSKKSSSKRQVVRDWEWVGSEVKAVEEITPEHCRRAAGLAGGKPCTLAFPNGPGIVSSDTSPAADRKSRNDSLCKAGRCKSSPWCLNHLGAEEVFDAKAEEKHLQEVSGAEEESRDGPAGLRNLGATCYANAFLQLWFHNVTFRNGVYDCVTSENSPLYHLAVVFALLQYSANSVVDPMGLIEALRLDKGNQQDAGEFSKLFISLIASEFAKSPDPAMKTFMAEQFEGKMMYTTLCSACGWRSQRETAFLELELPLTDNISLNQAIMNLVLPENLTGDNQYRCSGCNKLQDATRTQSPSVLPPVLHISLLRFVYDLKSASRKKSKAAMKYPNEIVLGNSMYDLRGVITHQGTSAHHGHFVCEVYDEQDDEWYICNDEFVTKKNVRPTKKIRLDPDESPSRSPPLHSSKDAYMLVYKRRDGDQPPKAPPPLVMDRVKAENAAFEMVMKARGERKVALKSEFKAVTDAKKRFLAEISGWEVLVPRDALALWLKSTTLKDLEKPFDMTPILCEHGAIDPDKVSDSRMISAAAHDQLRRYSDVPQLDICTVCVANMFTEVLETNDHAALLNELDTMDSIDENEYILPRAWINAWRSRGLPKGALPSDEQFGLYCPHGGRSNKHCQTVGVGRGAMGLILSLVGAFTPLKTGAEVCVICALDDEREKDVRKSRADELKVDRAVKKHVEIGPAFGVDYFLLPERFSFAWESYLRGVVPQPTLEMDFCQHGLLDFDPQMEWRKTLTEPGWEMLCEKYGAQIPVRVQFGPNPVPGKMTRVSKYEPAICEPCHHLRRITFDSIDIQIVYLIEPSAQDKHLTFRPMNSFAKGRARRSRAKERVFSVTATKKTTVGELKVSILQQTNIYPMMQKIFYDHKELESYETIESIGFLMGDRLVLEEAEEQDLDDSEKSEGRGEGFSGTALVARIACPSCTFENDGFSKACEICGTVFKGITRITT